MALSRIRKGMIADGAVTPENLDPTADFEFNKVITPEIGVSGTSGLRIDTLRASTSSWVAFYNPTTKEISYGPSSAAGGTGQTFDQTLNTTDRVRFAGVSSTTATITSATITAGFVNSLRVNNAYNLPTADGAANQFIITNGLGQWSYKTGPNQDLNTTNSPTFVNLTLSGQRFTVNTATIATANITNGSVSGLFTTSYLTVVNNAAIGGNLTANNITVNSTMNVNTIQSTGTFEARSIKLSGGPVDWGLIGDYGVGGDLYIRAGNGGSITVGDPTTGGPRALIKMYGDILPYTHNKTTHPRSLGSATFRWQTAWIETITVGRNTIIFEDEENASTSTLSIQTGTIYVDGIAVIDQNVTTGGTPVFSDTTITNSLTINDYTMPPAIASTAGYAMVSGASGQIEFQQAVLSSNISIDGGFSTSVYTIDDFRVDGGGAFA